MGSNLEWWVGWWGKEIEVRWGRNWIERIRLIDELLMIPMLILVGIFISEGLMAGWAG